ncbi:MAG: Outer membrane protein assembly factor BamB precursor [Lentisphaerae bacterium ADurb.BinA184]|nr:MAG: Outer membrane protein assembly factor BamB precursor [Lentisphaerae bacterium ADurb.BinA184]
MAPTPEKENPAAARRRAVGQVAWGVAAVAAVFVVAVGTLLFADRLAARRADPLNAPALTELRERFAETPGDDAVRENLRQLDLVARRAVFSSLWRRRSGAALLAGGVAVLVAAASVATACRRQLPVVAQCPGADREDEWDAAALARRIVFAATLLGLAAAATLALVHPRPHDVAVESWAESLVPESPRSATPAASVPGSSPAIVPTAESATPHWPGFRGPGGNGVADANTRPPTDWDGTTGKGILWKTPVPKPGYNSPAVAGNLVFLSGADEKTREVYCFDAETGRLLWSRPVAGVPASPPEVPQVTADTGFAAPSMATDGKGAFAIFANGDVAAFELDGRPRWARNLGLPENHYGHSSSLLAWNDFLLIQYDEGARPRLLALKTADGETAWEVVRETEISWASPILVRQGTADMLILNASPAVAAYLARTGTELWRSECMSGEVGSSAVFADGRVFAANAYAALVCLDADSGAELWRTDEVALPDVASLAAAAGLVFLAASDGTVTCVHADTGKPAWEHAFDSGFYSSPVVADGKVYLIDKEGVAHILAAAAEFSELAVCPLGEGVVTTPAFVGGRIYIRGGAHLYGVGAAGP